MYFLSDILYIISLDEHHDKSPYGDNKEEIDKAKSRENTGKKES